MVRPDEVKSKASRLEEKNYKFRAFLKNRADDDELDAQFLILHKELFAGYDCCKCANCCKIYRIILDDAEVTRISAFLGMTEGDFSGMLKYFDYDDIVRWVGCKFKPAPHDLSAQ